MCPVVAVIWWLSILVIYFCNRVRHHCTDWCPVITRSMTITNIKHTMIMYKHINKRSQSTAIIHKNTLPHAQIIMLYGFHDFIMLLLRLCIQRNKDPCRHRRQSSGCSTISCTKIKWKTYRNETGGGQNQGKANKFDRGAGKKQKSYQWAKSRKTKIQNSLVELNTGRS